MKYLSLRTELHRSQVFHSKSLYAIVLGHGFLMFIIPEIKTGQTQTDTIQGRRI